MPDFDTDKDGDIYPSSWSDLMLLVQGISLSGARCSPRWVSDKKIVKDKHFEKAMDEHEKGSLSKHLSCRIAYCPFLLSSD